MNKIKIEEFKTEEEWLLNRLGRITGTKAGGLFSKRDKKPLKGYYEIIAERVAVPHDGENVMFRGKRLEDDAVERFNQETGKKAKRKLTIVSRADEPDICYSPDALINKSEDVEVKCLNSAAHIEALLTKQVPSEYEMQLVQGFIVNDSLKKRYLVFYDPRMPRDFFYLTIERKDMLEKIEEYLALERQALIDIKRIESELTFAV